jgi:signal transduction histidine kinase
MILISFISAFSAPEEQPERVSTLWAVVITGLPIIAFYEIVCGRRSRIKLPEAASFEAKSHHFTQTQIDFISNVVHDLKSSLGLIKLAVSALTDPEFQTDFSSRNELLTSIEDEIERLDCTLHNLLDLSLEAGHRIVLHQSPADVFDLLRNAIESQKIMLRTGQSLAIDFPDAEIVMNLDGIRIVRVLRNLLENAIKYSPEGGTITIIGSVGEQTLRICVQDQGIGISSQNLSKVFDRFYRAADDNAHYPDGYGIGLPAAAAIIQAHGGEIWAESVSGVGSRFLFTLPLDLELKGYETDPFE